MSIDGSFKLIMFEKNLKRTQMKKLIAILLTPISSPLFLFLLHICSLVCKAQGLNAPLGVATDQDGKIYVANQGRDEIGIYSNGGILMRTIGSQGNADGQFNGLSNLTIGINGNIYAVDNGNGRIQVFDHTGTFLFKFGSIGTGNGQFGSLDAKSGTELNITADDGGNIYVADFNNNRIQIFDNMGVFIKMFGTSGMGDGQLKKPLDIALDRNGNIYVLDFDNRIQVFNNSGVFLRKFVAPILSNTQFVRIAGIEVDDSGVYLIDSGNKCFWIFDSTGNLRGRFGSKGYRDGQFRSNNGLTIDHLGNIIIADSQTNRVQVFDHTGIFKFMFGTTQPKNRYMVFFKDKTGSLYDVGNPAGFLSQRAINRRIRENTTISVEDLPISEEYVQGVSSAGATLLYKTKWMNGILVECESSLVPALEQLPFVSRVEYVAHGGRPIENIAEIPPSSPSSVWKERQLSMIGIDHLHNSGYHGEGLMIAVFDTGFMGANTALPFQHVFSENRFDAVTSFDFVHGIRNVFKQHDHGTKVWSVIGAKMDGSFTGGAFKANFVLFVTEDVTSEFRIEEYNWLFAAERADSVGVDVINTSLGYTSFDDGLMNYSFSDLNGNTSVITNATRIAANKGIAVIVSAGNKIPGSDISSPWDKIFVPADGDDLLAVGGVTSDGSLTSFSCVGPSADGRIKPDVAAMAQGVLIVSPNGSIGEASGTSFSSPLIASLTALLWQREQTLKGQELLSKIRHYGNQASNPDNLLGYGIPNPFTTVTETPIDTSHKLPLVFPNPVSNELTVEFSNDSALREMYLLNSSGLIFTIPNSQIIDHQFKLNLASIPPGIYLLRMWFQDGSAATQKILKH
jgi:serine protease AprX